MPIDIWNDYFADVDLNLLSLVICVFSFCIKSLEIFLTGLVKIQGTKFDTICINFQVNFEKIWQILATLWHNLNILNHETICQQ